MIHHQAQVFVTREQVQALGIDTPHGSLPSMSQLARSFRDLWDTAGYSGAILQEWSAERQRQGYLLTFTHPAFPGRELYEKSNQATVEQGEDGALTVTLGEEKASNE